MKKDWILILATKSSIVNKEQTNGLESIGSVVTDTEEEPTPMDDVEEGTKDNTTPTKTETVKDDGEDSETNTEDSIDSTDLGDETDTVSSTSDDALNMDENPSSGTDTNTMDDPNISENRRILLSDKLMTLYWSIRDSIDTLNESSSFDKKPVILNELDRLSDVVKSINASINNSTDYKIIMLKYTMCVKTYNRIMNEI